MIGQPNQPTNALAYLLSIKQVAERLGVTVRHVRRLVFERRIPYVKSGHLLRFDPPQWTASSKTTRTNPGGRWPPAARTSRGFNRTDAHGAADIKGSGFRERVEASEVASWLTLSIWQENRARQAAR